MTHDFHRSFTTTGGTMSADPLDGRYLPEFRRTGHSGSAPCRVVRTSVFPSAFNAPATLPKANPPEAVALTKAPQRHFIAIFQKPPRLA